MTIQITIIGLGQIGASAGLALGEYADEIFRVGHDKDSFVARKAKQKGAVNKTTITLQNAVKDADVVLLALPVHAIRSTLEYISQDLKEDAVVIDTAPVKRVVEKWAAELLPPQRYYVGLTPVINPAYLQDFDFGIEAAQKDLFKGSLIGLVSGPKTSPQAIKVAANLITLLGAKLFFASMAEIDGLMTLVHIMPQLMASALLSATTTTPGWRDGRKLAGRAYAQASEPLGFGGNPEALANMVVNNNDNVTRVIDDAIRSLQSLRHAAANQNEDALIEYFQDAHNSRNSWWVNRQDGIWADTEVSENAPSLERKSMFKQMFGFGGNIGGKGIKGDK